MRRNPYNDAIGHLNADIEVAAGDEPSSWPRGHIRGLQRAVTLLENAPELLKLAAFAAEFIAAGEMEGTVERRVTALRAVLAKVRAR